ncbi:Protein ariadne-2 [Exaiptasia diaphana]|nr:Protein ariadne-2 [Exaiptasia diaphana]
MSFEQEDIEEAMDADSSDYGDDDDDDEDDYYTRNDGEDEGIDPNQEEDPENFDYSLLSVDETMELLGSMVAKASKDMQIPHHLARLLLVAYSWDVGKLLERHRVDPAGLMVDLHLVPKKQPRSMCRYSVMYTYPYAYYMEDDRKKLKSVVDG